MKALSVRQPYARQILTGEKKIEYRSWTTDYRGPILICSSASWAVDEDEEFPRPSPEVMKRDYPRGVAVCVVDLVRINDYCKYNRRFCDWYLANPRPVKQFPVKGRLHLFDVPDELIELI